MNAREDMRPIVAFEGIYSITEDGRVWSHERVVATGGNRKSRVGGRWLKACRTSSYLVVVLSVNGKTTHPMIHRLVAEAFVPNPNGYPEVNHIDGNKLNNHASNLEWVTRSMNQKHAWKSGLQKTTPARIAQGRRLHQTFAPWRNK